MARGRFVLRDGQLVEKRFAAPLVPVGPRSDLSAPMIGSDACDIVSMADGHRYTSKARYRSEIAARGYDEVGNDIAPLFERPVRAAPNTRPAVERAFAEHGV